MLKRIFKHRSRRNQKYDIVTGPNSLPVSVSTDGDKSIFNVGVDGWSEGEKNELFAKAVKMSDMTVYEGHIEHAYSRRHAYQTNQCPRCGADTRQQYGNFIYATQIAPLNDICVLNHKSIFQKGTPPMAPIAEITRREGALLELDKHNWPWSMMLVPVMGVDLFELSNNHVWRTEFAFSKFGLAPPDYMNIETDEKGLTERGWIEYGFLNYYALLNCGFGLRPTAGTASGVHPVPLGFGRVYVRLKEGFDYKAWAQGLDEGRSFVTTGPMLFVTVDGFEPGHTFKQAARQERAYKIAGTAQSPHPLERIEIIVNGKVAETIKPENKLTSSGAYLSTINQTRQIKSTSWIAVRCFENRPDKRVRFAHTACFGIEVEGRPLRPRKEEIAFLIKRMEKQIARNKDVLGEQALEEYHKALRIYKNIAKAAQ